jgi:hypothetical protein
VERILKVRNNLIFWSLPVKEDSQNKRSRP